MTETALERARDSVAERFTRLMRASTSARGMLTDPPLVCFAVAAIVLTSLILYNRDVIQAGALPVVYVAAALPVVVALAVHATLAGARGRVIAWLASLPFPLQNMNGLLNGVGQDLVVAFRDLPPTREALNARLEEVDPDCFTLEIDEEVEEVEIRIGVLDSKLNPTRSNYQRYLRVQRIVAEVLVPLHAEHPIQWVRVR
ncbi:MAG: hypothetical protein KC731_10305 [Myxococcales bacterium]|nr:hypothetical protein [Myxococcales bacterium]